MMCRPEERDLAHAAERALAEASARGLAGEALIEAATEAVAAVWAHVDPALIRAAVVERLRGESAARGSARSRRDPPGS
jgi:hypothetical protein